MTNRRKLGRGLDSLISDKVKIEDILKPSDETDENKITEIPIESILPNSEQPRRNFSEDSLEELSKSIKQFGILQPIIVTKTGDKYRIVAGERRYRAALKAGIKTIPSMVRNFDGIELEKVALIENVQREDLNSIDEAIAYKKIIEKYSVTQEELAKAIGKSRPYISNSIRLLRLDDRVIELMKDGRISHSMGKVLLSINDPDEQYEKALDIIKTGKSVHQVSGSKRRKKKSSEVRKDIYLTKIEDDFMDVLGTKVRIDSKKKVISINYYDDDDLNRIIETIVGGIN